MNLSEREHHYKITHLSSSRGTAPESLFDERSAVIGFRCDIEFKKFIGIVPTRSLSVFSVQRTNEIPEREEANTAKQLQ